MTGNATITYFETAMAKIQVGSVIFLTDPVLDDAGVEFDYGPVHLKKTGGRIVTEQDMGRVDAVLLSHDQHGDNLDHGGRQFLSRAPQVLTTPLAASRLTGTKAVGLERWQQTTVIGPAGDRVTVTAVPARHGPAGTEEITGPVTGFILQADETSARSIYISGDTVLFDGTEEIVRRYAPVGVALLNLGRARLAPMGDVNFSLTANEAAVFAKALNAKSIVPLHFDGWEHFTEERHLATKALASSVVADRVRWLHPGEPEIFSL
jgi:L-ascorbate metabolism protein UlaG (beta-lactamase superfamily)